MRTNSSHINCHGYVLSEVETLPCPQPPQTQRYSQSPAGCLVASSGVTRQENETRPSIETSPTLAHLPTHANQPRPRARGRLARYHLVISAAFRQPGFLGWLLLICNDQRRHHVFSTLPILPRSAAAVPIPYPIPTTATSAPATACGVWPASRAAPDAARPTANACSACHGPHATTVCSVRCRPCAIAREPPPPTARSRSGGTYSSTACRHWRERRQGGQQQGERRRRSQGRWQGRRQRWQSWWRQWQGRRTQRRRRARLGQGQSKRSAQRR